MVPVTPANAGAGLGSDRPMVGPRGKQADKVGKMYPAFINLREKISIHHIGGRLGERGFPVNPAFEGDLINVLYDADAECLDQAEGLSRGLGSETHVFPFCLGESRGKATFHLKYDPNGSSLLTADPKAGDFYAFDNYYDYLISEAGGIVRSLELDLVNLDHLCEAGLISAPAPDFLSIDAEGAEIGIIRGAERVLRGGCLALMSEVCLEPYLAGHTTFGDIAAALGDYGYHFVKFSHPPVEFSPFRAPIGLRGEGFQFVSDVLYLRKVEAILALDLEPTAQARMLAKLAFIALCFNQMEYAVKCLLARRSLIPAGAEAEPACNYLKMLAELEAALRRMPAFYPVRFAAVYTPESSRERFQPGAQAGPPSYGIAPDKVSELCQRFVDSEVEALLRRHGLRALAELVKRKRLTQAMITLYDNGYAAADGQVNLSQETIERYLREQRGRY